MSADSEDNTTVYHSPKLTLLVMETVDEIPQLKET